MSCEYSDLVLTPQALSFTMKEGAQFMPPYQSVEIDKATNDQSTNWAATADAQWIRFHPPAGYGKGTIAVTVRTDTPLGIYHANLTISSSVKILPSPVVAITLEVTPVEPPAPQPEPEPEPPAEPDPQPAPEPKPQPEPEPQPSRLSRVLKVLETLYRALKALITYLTGGGSG